MIKETLQSQLASADPVAEGADDSARALVRRMSAEARAAYVVRSRERAPWWKRPRTVLPVGLVGLAALTGAAVLVPLGLSINGTQVDPDVEIPIAYTTDTGTHVSCRYGIYFGDPAHRSVADERLAEFVETHDWTGIGQRVYDEATANPYVPGPDDDWEVDNQEVRDRFSFNRALELIWDEIPDELEKSAQMAGGTSDCTGKLR